MPNQLLSNICDTMVSQDIIGDQSEAWNQVALVHKHDWFDESWAKTTI